MDRINKYLPLLGWTAIIGTIVGGIYFFGGFMNTMEEGVLTPEQKVKIIRHEESAPNDVDSYKAFQKWDSANAVVKKNEQDAIRSRKERDSLYKVTQDVGRRNADQIWQMRQQQDTIIKLLKK